MVDHGNIGNSLAVVFFSFLEGKTPTGLVRHWPQESQIFLSLSALFCNRHFHQCRRALAQFKLCGQGEEKKRRRPQWALEKPMGLRQ